MSKFDCTVSFTYELNTWIREIVSEEIGEGQEANDPIATGAWCSAVLERLDNLDGFVGETSVEDLESTVDSLTNLNSNETDIDELADKVASHSRICRSLHLAVDQVKHNVGGKVDELKTRCAVLLEQQLINQAEISSLRGKTGELLHCQETYEENIADLHRQVKNLTQWIAGFRKSMLLTTGQPGFLADLTARGFGTPDLNARFAADDKAAVELLKLIDEVTDDLETAPDGGSDTH